MPRGGELQLPTGSCSSPPPPEAGRYRPLGAVSTWHSIGAVGLGGLGARRREQRTPISFQACGLYPAVSTSASPGGPFSPLPARGRGGRWPPLRVLSSRCDQEGTRRTINIGYTIV